MGIVEQGAPVVYSRLPAKVKNELWVISIPFFPVFLLNTERERPGSLSDTACIIKERSWQEKIHRLLCLSKTRLASQGILIVRLDGAIALVVASEWARTLLAHPDACPGDISITSGKAFYPNQQPRRSVIRSST
jgi:hypothetical protein